MGNTETAKQKFTWLDVVRTIGYFLGKDRFRFGFFVFLLFVIFFYTLVPAFIVGKIADFFTHYTRGETLRPFYTWILILGGSYILAALIRLTSKNQVSVLGKKIRSRARIWGFERLTEFSLAWHHKENTGAKIQRIFTGADAMNSLINSLQKDIIKIAVDIFGTLAVFLFTDVKFIAVTFTYAVLFLFLEFKLSKKILKLSNEFNTSNQSAGGVYMETAGNMLAVKALGSENVMSERVSYKEEHSLDISIRRTRAGYNKWYFLQFVNGTTFTVFLYITGRSVIGGMLSIGMIFVFFTYFLKLRDALADLSDLHTDLIDLRSGIGNMMPIFRETEPVDTGNKPFPKEWDAITLDAVKMNYDGGEGGLKNFTLELPRGSKVGVAGLSGGGKSTLAKTLLGLYRIAEGSFCIGGEDYYSIAHTEVLTHMSVVLQETELFNFSFRDNITMMRPLDEALLAKAIDIAELAGVLERLPEGLDSMVGEKGHTLSGGERQRLGIARAVYKNAEIIIFDEATSALDSTTEEKVMNKLFGEYGEGKTFLIIAHRLGTLKNTDRVIVLGRGTVVETGEYDTIIADPNSAFYKLSQTKKKEKI